MKKFASFLLTGAVFFSVSCKKENAGSEREVKIAYLHWTSEIASSHVVASVIQDRLGVRCSLLPVSESSMWQAVATGKADFIVSAWLPASHEAYLLDVKDNVEIVRKNLTGSRIGLVVPSYVPLNSLYEVNHSSSEFKNIIYGIDSGSGVNRMTERMLADYAIKDMAVFEGSSSGMAETLGMAIKNRSWIIVAGWTPHWMFAKWDLKFLKDPKRSFGEEEYIATVARIGLKKDYPEVYSFLEKFNWNLEDIQRVMLLIRESESDPRETVKIWLMRNRHKVDNWLGKKNNYRKTQPDRIER